MEEVTLRRKVATPPPALDTRGTNNQFIDL